MLKRFFWTTLLGTALFAGWHYGYQATLRYFFRISGSVSVAEALKGSLPGANGMLFVIARNERGVPVAVKKIINPVFPARFEMTPSSLIMPDLLTRRVYLEAALNTHGQLGTFRKGDLRGERAERANIRDKGLEIRLDSGVK